jgi:hypothetical protein
MFKINTEKELLSLLRVVSEEAVKKSKRNLRESSDPYADRFSGNLKSELETLFEQEEEEVQEEEEEAEGTAAAEEVEVDEEPAAAEEPDASADDAEDLPAAEKAMSLDDTEGGYSFDSVITAINTLRAGRSLRDKEIKDELSGYYDRLDENEREILFLFLKELSKILTGAIEAEEAQDPSDPKHFFDIIKREEGEEASKTSNDVEKKPETQQQAQAAIPVSDEEEDTTPPIKVNESQDVRALREKVRRLMRD